MEEGKVLDMNGEPTQLEAPVEQELDLNKELTRLYERRPKSVRRRTFIIVDETFEQGEDDTKDRVAYNVAVAGSTYFGLEAAGLADLVRDTIKEMD